MVPFRALALLVVLFLAPAALAGPRVLILWDVRNEQTRALATSLTNSGAEVVFSDTSGPGFNGDNPSLKTFDVVVHLNGTTWQSDMPLSGQRALVRFVENGGGYLHHEWNAYQLSVGQLQALRPLILFDRSSGYSGDIQLQRVESAKVHPVIWEVPKTFSMTGGCNVGHVHVFDEEPSVVLARDAQGNDAIAVREHGFGRIVGFHHGGNWSYSVPGALMNSNEARRMFVDGVRWAYGCDPTFREGRREKMCVEIAKRKGK